MSQNLPFNVGSKPLPIPNAIDFLAKPKSRGEVVMEWTPELAAYVIAHHNGHENQRSMNMNDAAKLARVIKAGQWREEHRITWIVFDSNGNLINGQHTLYAISQGKTALRIRTAWGDDPADIALYDNFRPRSTAYLVGCRGCKFTTLRAAFTRLRLILDKNLHQAKVDATEVVTITEGDRIANAIINRFATSVREIRQGGIPPAVAAYAAWRIAKVHGIDKTWAFFESMLAGVNLPEDDQRLQLIRQFRAGSWAQQGERNRGIALIITAWNNHHEKSRAKLRLKSPGTIPAVNP